jgi:hypothetical protein
MRLTPVEGCADGEILHRIGARLRLQYAQTIPELLITKEGGKLVSLPGKIKRRLAPVRIQKRLWREGIQNCFKNGLVDQ